MLAPPIIFRRLFWLAGRFMFTGVLALVWVLLWWAFYYNPEKHPNLSKEELAYIKQDNEAPAVKLPFFALKTVAKNKRFYGIAIPAFMAEPAWAVLSFWVPCIWRKSTGWTLSKSPCLPGSPSLPPIWAAWQAAISPNCIPAGSAAPG
jgi:ACS family hexuronate transporter-like MFS transporter